MAVSAKLWIIIFVSCSKIAAMAMAKEIAISKWVV